MINLVGTLQCSVSCCVKETTTCESGVSEALTPHEDWKVFRFIDVKLSWGN